MALALRSRNNLLVRPAVVVVSAHKCHEPGAYSAEFLSGGPKHAVHISQRLNHRGIASGGEGGYSLSHNFLIGYVKISQVTGGGVRTGIAIPDWFPNLGVLDSGFCNLGLAESWRNYGISPRIFDWPL